MTHRLRDGRIEVVELPEPAIGRNEVLVEVHASVISPGTERATVTAGRQSLAGKARSRPDEVRRVLEKARTDGIRETVEAVRLRLDAPAGLGYSAAGVVVEVGDLFPPPAPGDRVACAGASYAVHAELIRVPGNLCARIPDGVGFEEAAFATVGAIALHGVRQSGAALGEVVAVIGLGLVGQLTGQLLRAAGCVVVGVDLSRDLLETALASGAADRVFLRSELDGSLPEGAGGCDAVVITAATSTNDPVQVATRLARDRGRVVVVGDVNTSIPRDAFYAKELELRLSRSYGPGRYDSEYEERGLDYPIGYVRWTERRNLGAFLELVAAGRVVLEPLVGERLPLSAAATAYDRLLDPERKPLGIVLEYEAGAVPRSGRRIATAPTAPAAAVTDFGLIGSGSFASRVLLPSLGRAGFELRAVASATGLSAASTAGRASGVRAVTPDELLADPELGLVVVATRHDSHAALAQRALAAGKAVFVEKPPALSEEELAAVREARAASGLPLAVGFNRRFAPLAVALREHLRAAVQPIELLYRVSAGPLPDGHWLNDLEVGGGRLLGEGCHFVDFACWLAGELPARVDAHVRPPAGKPLAAAESFAIVLDFPGGSRATILYHAAGSSRLGKERVEAHAGDRSAVLADYRTLELLAGRKRRRLRSRGDKGHAAQFAALRSVLQGETRAGEPDPLDTMAATLAALQAAAGRSA